MDILSLTYKRKKSFRSIIFIKNSLVNVEKKRIINQKVFNKNNFPKSIMHFFKKLDTYLDIEIVSTHTCGIGCINLYAVNLDHPVVVIADYNPHGNVTTKNGLFTP